ncbi:MAG: putative nucleotide-diphospho-sugar transferase [Alphaproteobacteria bacterium]
MKPAKPELPEGVSVTFNAMAAFSAAPFIVVSLYTDSYEAKVQRLIASCRALKLPGAFYRLPAVHNSISLSGVDDLAYTKSEIIRLALRTFGKPVLYVDADMVFKDPPEKIRALTRGCDFAVYNWLTDPEGDAWQIFEVPMPNGKSSGNRFWCFRFALDLVDERQLMTSGATQFWAATPAAVALLEDWQAVLAEYPATSDDECLDFAFNNRDNSALRCAWLDKSYVRYAWWPHIKPVINHPDLVTVSADRNGLTEKDERKRYYPNRAKYSPPSAACYPRSLILDIQDKRLLKNDNGLFVPVGNIKGRFWI